MNCKKEYKEWLYNLTKELENIHQGDETELIYVIDELNIYGNFEDGYRGIDHNILLNDQITWEQIMTYGTVIVPETETYISDYEIQRFRQLGYTNLPLNSNHIVGYRELEHLNQGVELDPWL